LSPVHDVSGNVPENIRQRFQPALDILAALTVFFAAIAVYRHSTGYYFSQDDFTFLARAEGLRASPGFWSPFGTRIISGRLYFDFMYRLFGLNPVPYHWANLLLHALNAVFVYVLARRWTGTKLVALVAGLVFATLDVGFTAVFWISGIQDLLATMFLLLAALIWITPGKKGWASSVFSAVALGLSMLCKETGLLFPAVFLLMAWAQGGWRPRKMTLLAPHLAISCLAAIVLTVQESTAHASAAYAVGITSDVVHNMATYALWTADVFHPFRDRVAAIDYDAWKLALAIGLVLILLLVTSRGRQARAQLAALGWYVSAIAAVLPLLHHTYLYYLYPAVPGAAILIGIFADRLRAALARRFGSRGNAAAWIVSLAAIALLCTGGFVNVRARENALLPPDYKLPYDHVLRSSVFARNAVQSFTATSIPTGADLVFINPFAPANVNLAEDGDPEGRLRSYDMVKAALRDGLVIRLLRPDLNLIDFAYRMEPRWEKAYGFLYDAFGVLTYLGTGADIWSNLSTVYLREGKDLGESMKCSRRALQLRPDQPRANLNLGIALAMTGSTDEARVYLSRAAELAPAGSLRDNALKWMNSLD
jgi:tetratricopeptide (TPR) repeat protein